ncbi:uncharacterized protein CTRU02_201000 [Colletotrichum truncatum]|uniref:Uncharacterized protein n=1 Tax=Colletotrichum truncatum TaxID=5467 RepID=A0ACC3ZGA0_COLTU|nr:uncharacterized protein CTRU02_00771 [Colletotrichum truncatum]KAF6802022.1 hypothetical protein CTRU02_00771 [Colletotrichum truncatum]
MASAASYYRWILFFLLAVLWILFASQKSYIRENKNLSTQASATATYHDDADVIFPSNSISTETAFPPLTSSSDISALIPDPPTSASSQDDTETISTHKPRVLIVFSYTESDRARENLKYFIKHGLHLAADFLFIFNGQTDAAIEVPLQENIRIVKREKTCFDLGSTGEIIRADDLWNVYDRFIIMNASLRGPFLPYWSDSCWSDRLLAKITDTVKLVGITAKCWPSFHIPSVIWATDKVGMAFLLDFTIGRTTSVFGGLEDPVGLSGCYKSLKQAAHAEVGATSVILEAGYSVDVLMSSFHKDFDSEAYCDSAAAGVLDPFREGSYLGVGLHPYETMFLRTSRGADSPSEETLSSLMGDMAYSSYQSCKR